MGKILAHALVAAMFAAFVSGKPAAPEQGGTISEQVKQILIQQLCSMKSIPDCERRARECHDLMELGQGGDITAMCPGISALDCMAKVTECSEILNPNGGTPGGGPAGGMPSGGGPAGGMPSGGGPAGGMPSGGGPAGGMPSGGGPAGGMPSGGGHAGGMPSGGGPAGGMTPGGGPAGAGPNMTPQQQVQFMCSVSEDPNCQQEIMNCLMMSMQLMPGTDGTARPEPWMCAATDIVDCKAKINECNEKMTKLMSQMGPMVTCAEEGDTSMMADDEDEDDDEMMEGQTGMLRKDKEDRPVKIKENGNNRREGRGGGRKRGGGGRKGRGRGKGDRKDDSDEDSDEDDDSDEDSDEDDDSDEDSDEDDDRDDGDKRKKRDAHDTMEEEEEYEEDDDDDDDDEGDDEFPMIALGGLTNFMGEVDEMMRQIDEMLAHFNAIISVIDKVYGEEEEDAKGGMKLPGMLSRAEKVIFLTKYMCDEKADSECASNVENCACWLAQGSHIPIRHGSESRCPPIVPPASMVADTCDDFSSEECQAEVVSCMNLLVATGGTKGDAGPLTPHVEQCEAMLMRMLVSESSSPESSESECAIAIDECMDTIRVEVDEIHDHHYPANQKCEPMMRPAIALYMCSSRDEPDCFIRMHKCMINMAPDSDNLKTLDPNEMMGCLKLTRPLVGSVCGLESEPDCEVKYDTCNELVQLNSQFMKAAQQCMGMEDDEMVKDCMRPAMNEVRNSVDNESVQPWLNKLFEEVWTPNMGIIGIHSCMVGACSMGIEL